MPNDEYAHRGGTGQNNLFSGKKLMETYLQEISKKINKERSLVFFPSTKASFKFHEIFKGKGVFISSLEKFVFDKSGIAKAESWDLKTNLFKQYTKLYQPDFPGFLNWADTILHDFNTIDIMLADAEKLFQRVYEAKEMESLFSGEEDESYSDFWKSFMGTPSVMKQQFLEFWEKLFHLYTRFRKELLKSKTGYDGMIWREFAESSFLKHFANWDKIYFCGFNILTGCERKIIQELINAGKAEYIPDADKYYVNNEKHEAGRFIRRNLRMQKSSETHLINSLSTKEYNFHFYKAPKKYPQIKQVCRIVEEKLREDSSKEICIVLPDNSIGNILKSELFKITEIDYTIPELIKYTSYYDLLRLIVKSKEKVIQDEGIRYFYKDAVKILSNPIVSCQNKEAVNELICKIKNGKDFHIKSEELITNDLTKVIFSDLQNNFCKYADAITESCISSSSGSLKETLLKCSERIKSLEKSLNELELDENSKSRILMYEIGNIMLPYNKNENARVKVTGMLETRSLTYETIIIPCMNEGTYPSQRSSISYIPYSIKRAFSLPLIEDEDAGYAYNFYRLIQRAKEIHLLYDGIEGDFSSGEKSRYLIQTANELAEKNKNISIKEHTINPPLPLNSFKNVVVDKTEEVMKVLESKNRFSPSRLSTYINCSLQFYFKYIANIEEGDELDEIFSAAEFGKILHKVMFKLYQPVFGKDISKYNINLLESKIEDTAKEAVLSETGKDGKALKGKNRLLFKTICSLVCDIIKIDVQTTGLKIHSAEKEMLQDFEIDGRTIILNGKIDRIDSLGGITRIVDYKTGQASLKGKDQSVEAYFTNPKFKTHFQLLIYWYLYKKETGEQNVLPGVFGIKQSEKQVNTLPEIVLTDFAFVETESYLKKLLEEIYDKSIPFGMTDDAERCKWCSYKSICNRN